MAISLQCPGCKQFYAVEDGALTRSKDLSLKNAARSAGQAIAARK